MFYGCCSLDNVTGLSGGVTVHFLADGRNPCEIQYTGEEAAKRMAGIAFRKYVEGVRIRTRFVFDYSLGAKVLEYVDYGNGYVERWSWN